MTEDEFLCSPENCNVGDHMVPPLWRALKFLKMDVGRLTWQIDQDYSIHRLGPNWGDVVVCFKDTPVGKYDGQVLSVDPEHQTKELATAMIIAAVPYRARPSQRDLTYGGEKALRRAHRVATGKQTTRLILTDRIMRFEVVEVTSAGLITSLRTDDLIDAELDVKRLTALGKTAMIHRPLG